jgi:hypothetical protein
MRSALQRNSIQTPRLPTSRSGSPTSEKASSAARWPSQAHDRFKTKDPAAYNNTAWIYATQAKNLDEALALGQKAQELAPNAGAILDTLGFVHY